jgi:signal recognition particle receptor subunit beta
MIETIEALSSIYNKAEKYGLIDHFLEFFSKPVTIVALGMSGAGKSNFLASVQDLNAEIVSSLDRTKFVNISKAKLGGIRLHFVDTPGHEGYSTQRKEAIISAIKQPRAMFVNVTCAGYAEHERPIEDFFDGSTEVRAKVLSAQRELEIAQLLEWVNLVGSDGERRRLITVISKADLWWNDRTAILSHYEKGVVLNLNVSSKFATDDHAGSL